MKLKKIIALSLMLLFISELSFGQTTEAEIIKTTVDFLKVTPDARAAAMGDIGVTTSADAASLFHNPAKSVFQHSTTTIAIFYTPWLKNYIGDVFVGGGSYIKRINERGSMGLNFKYFSLGETQETIEVDGKPVEIGIRNPNELAFDFSYAMKLSTKMSIAVTMRYIYSNLNSNLAEDINSKEISTFAVDISGFYQSEEKNYGTFNGVFRFGYNLSNLGPKVSYGLGQEEFMPTSLKIGSGFEFILDPKSTLIVNTGFTKLLVPSPPIRDSQELVIKGKDDDVSWLEGVFQSFSDSPNGFKGEMEETTWAVGLEYIYNKAFIMRTGLFKESDLNGNKDFMSLGIGFKTDIATVDMSYLISKTDAINPLENTFRFTLTFELGDIYE
ncbi:MAG: type IX secretion system outer membrane channel protein PorV [Flavobacteriaceae bacterium]|nr:type IX secretion system outer membrane channel protein PorV [Flavobacteriaceae bacterium]